MLLVTYFLAVFSVAWTLASEEGPFNILTKGRYVLGKYLGHGVECPICVGFWISLALWPVYLFFPWTLTPFAAHGLVTFLVVFLSRR